MLKRVFRWESDWCRFRFGLQASQFVLMCTFESQTSPIAALQMLWINLIMDTLAALCLATEKPSDDLLQRKPYGRLRPILSRLMATTIALTSVYQLVVLFVMTFQAPYMLDIDSNIHYINNSPGVYTHEPTQHFTFVFNTLTMMILFNEINCRKVHGERNVFTNLHNNYLFICIWVSCAVMQFLIIQYGGLVFETAPLTLDQWFWSIFFGVTSMIWYQVNFYSVFVLRLLCFHFFPNFLCRSSSPSRYACPRSSSVNGRSSRRTTVTRKVSALLRSPEDEIWLVENACEFCL